jgi:hypothetical protein
MEVNDVACHMLNYTHDELLKMSPRDIDASNPSELAGKWEKFYNGNSIIETEHISKDGLKYQLSSTCVYLILGARN